MRKSIIILSICTVVLLLGYCSFRGYEVWKQNHWMTLAKEFAAKGDGRDEYLCLQQVLRTSPKNVEACRLMANVTEAAHSPEALAWRQRVLDLNPDSLDDRLALARSAVIFRDYAMATNTLAGIDAAGRATAGYYNVAGALAIAQNRLAEAEADFRQAVQLDPTNPLPKLNLAIVQLHGHNPQDMAQARLVLQQISQTSTNLIIRSQAERELISDALQRKDNETALALSQKLARQNYALFTDKLLRLEVLDKTGNGAYPTEFAAVKREAAGQPQDLSALVIWLMERHQPGEALAW
ncbi:MAG TPA: tetratricopeptide repeat protein, partial [Verrucomicrobiae bacterium]|nr:tetratricopeptide repeat protein [Verrucomicrobiae bacterium]